jgi:DNA modification methylase
MHKDAVHLHIKYLPIERLQTDQSHLRRHSPRQVKTLSHAIEQLGFNNPILVDHEDKVIAGHCRLEAARLLNFHSVPTVRLAHLSPAQVRAYRIADNRIAELAEWDMEALKVELQALSALDFDLTLTGFEAPQLDLILNPVQKSQEYAEEEILQEKGSPVTIKGDIWVLGKHRIICADALKAKSYILLLEGKKADLVFTDPPYNVPIQGHVTIKDGYGHGEFAMASGEMSDKEFEGFLSRTIKQLRQYTTDSSIHYICMDWRHIAHLLAAGKAYNELKNICIWNKSNGGMGSLYRSKHEMICVFKNGDKPHVNNIELGKHGRCRTNVWDYAGQTSLHALRKEELLMHPTVKPVEMIADAILDCSKRNQLILDPFGGSGSTLIAAEKTSRQARLIEIEPQYVDVTIRRWQKVTRKEATLLSTGQGFNAVEAARKRSVA